MLESAALRSRAVPAVLVTGLALATVGPAGVLARASAEAGRAPSPTPPLLGAGTPPLPEDARSVEILGPDEPLFGRPEPRAPKRGAAALGARLPLYGARRGPGCDRRWLLVGPNAWVCESRVRLSPLPAPDPLTSRRYPDGLPYRYFFAGKRGSFGYRNLRTAELGAPDAQLEPSFAVALLKMGTGPSGESYGLTTKGIWVPMRDFGAPRPAPFRGVELKPGDDPSALAWVHVDDARVYSTPGRRTARSLARFTRVAVAEEKRHLARSWLRIGDDAWVRSRDVRRPNLSPAPPDVGPGEPWIDVAIDEQTLVAYEGAVPVFATLVSTGKGRPGTELATPKGIHRVWIKLRTSDMDNLEQYNARRLYAIQEVPWVLYFNKGYGLHGAFWHRSFGNVRSHGCVNLTPRDAQRLFHWAYPRLPAGWTAAFPTRLDPGTVVRVR